MLRGGPVPSPRRTTTARGLGWAHQEQRRNLLARHVNGASCWWCGRPMFKDDASNFDGEPLAADHSHARAHGGTIADRLLHATCNKQRGDGSRDTQRPALAAHPATQSTITVTSFGWTKAPAPHAHLVVDCRTIPNPHQVPALRPRSGLDRPVADWVMATTEAARLLDEATTAVTHRHVTTIAVGCSAGRHRSVAVAEALAARLNARGHNIDLHHRDLKTTTAPTRKHLTATAAPPGAPAEPAGGGGSEGDAAAADRARWCYLPW